MTHNEFRSHCYHLIRDEGGYGSQQALAQAVGVSVMTMSRWCRGTGTKPIIVTPQMQRCLDLKIKDQDATLLDILP